MTKTPAGIREKRLGSCLALHCGRQLLIGRQKAQGRLQRVHHVRAQMPVRSRIEFR
ncbi:MAG: hypothetical protein LBP22_14360 [Deltaproteobacteria bacterium]|nr:hypothetical protein [Deltaproteobacteria bacterium]